MLRYRKKLVSYFLLIAIMLSPLFSAAAMVEKKPDTKQNSPEGMMVDIVAERPLGLVATLGGTLVFLVSWPFSALGGNSAEAWDSLVVAPAKYTFQRPLGEHKK